MYEKILVAVDGSPTSNRGLAEAVRLAGLTGGRLRLVTVLGDLTFAMGVGGYGMAYSPELFDQMREASERVLLDGQQAAEAAGVPAEAELLEAPGQRVSDQIVDEARRCGADLIVLGTHGRRGVRRFVLGSDAEQIVREAPVPVLLVRSPEGDVEEGPVGAAA